MAVVTTLLAGAVTAILRLAPRSISPADSRLRMASRTVGRVTPS